MTNQHDDEDIKKALKGYKLKTPPKKVMANYEEEVLKKAHSESPSAFLGVSVSWILGFALLAGIVFGYVYMGKLLEPKPTRTIEKEVLTTSKEKEVEAKPASLKETNIKNEQSPAARSSSVSEAELDELAKELFILEMLGEDTGIMDGFENMATDLDFFTSIQTA